MNIPPPAKRGRVGERSEPGWGPLLVTPTRFLASLGTTLPLRGRDEGESH